VTRSTFESVLPENEVRSLTVPLNLLTAFPWSRHFSALIGFCLVLILEYIKICGTEISASPPL
jgi:hypothetical protein